MYDRCRLSLEEIFMEQWMFVLSVFLEELKLYAPVVEKSKIAWGEERRSDRSRGINGDPFY
jgi:hypothetical protein